MVLVFSFQEAEAGLNDESCGQTRAGHRPAGSREPELMELAPPPCGRHAACGQPCLRTALTPLRREANRLSTDEHATLRGSQILCVYLSVCVFNLDKMIVNLF